MGPAATALLQTPTPGLGPAELESVVPVLRRVGWFLGGVLVTGLVGWFVVEPAISRVVRRRNRGNRTIQDAIARYVRLVVALVALGVGAVLAGYGGWLTGSALVVAATALALGVAARSVVGSIVSGLVLVLDPAFNVGDAIAWEGGEGVVTAITLRVTRVRTPDGALVTVPDTVLTGQAITRLADGGGTRIVEHVAIAADADVDVALDQLVAAATELEAVRTDPPPTAYVDAFDGASVVVRVHYWIDGARRRDRHAVRSGFARAARRRLEAAGVGLGVASTERLGG